MFILIAPAFAIPVSLPSNLGFHPEYVNVEVAARSAVTVAGETTRCTVDAPDGACWFEVDPGDPVAIHGRGQVMWSEEKNARRVQADCTEAGCVTTLTTVGQGDEGDAWLLPSGRGTLEELDAVIALPTPDVVAALWARANEEALATLAACETCGAASADAGLALTREWRVGGVDRTVWDTAGFTANVEAEGGWTGALDCFDFYGDCDMHEAGCELVVKRGGEEVLRYRDEDGTRLVTMPGLTAGDDPSGGRVRGGAAATRW